MIKNIAGGGGEYGEGQEIENLIFIDFQYSNYTSPVIDLHYFLNMSLQDSLRPNRFDELIAFYHTHLEAYLTRLEFKKPIPSLDELQQQYLERSFYGNHIHLDLNRIQSINIFLSVGFIVSCLLQPIVLNQNTENADFEAVINDDERSSQYKQSMFASAKVQATLRKLIPFYNKLGVFD